MSSQPVCPQCGQPVEHHWEWCHNCGFDPEGKRPPSTAPLFSPSTSVTAPSVGPAEEHHDLGPAWDADSIFDPSPVADLGSSYDIGALDKGGSAFERGPVDDPGWGAGVPAAPPPGAGNDPSGPLPLYDPSSFTGSNVDASSFSTSLPPPPPASAEPAPAGRAGHAPASEILQKLPSFEEPLPPAEPGGPSGAGGGRLPTRSLSGLSLRSGNEPASTIPTRPERSRRLSLPSVSLPIGTGKVAAVVLALVVAVGVLSLVLTNLGGDPRSVVSSTTLDPSAPPPIGQLPLGERSTSTTPAVPSTAPVVPSTEPAVPSTEPAVPSTEPAVEPAAWVPNQALEGDHQRLTSGFTL